MTAVTASFPWRRQAVALAECHRATTADHRAGNVLHAVFHAGEHCRILGENLLFGNGDMPSMWDSVYDAQRNGPMVAFTRQLNPKVMVKPDDYSEETMKEVAARYEKEAKKINASRTENMTDSTVIYVLSNPSPTRLACRGLRSTRIPCPTFVPSKRIRPPV